MAGGAATTLLSTTFSHIEAEAGEEEEGGEIEEEEEVEAEEEGKEGAAPPMAGGEAEDEVFPI
jgi:hypothetical protein